MEGRVGERKESGCYEVDSVRSSVPAPGRKAELMMYLTGSSLGKANLIMRRTIRMNLSILVSQSGSGELYKLSSRMVV